jgi:predicted nucleic acid-binding protein
VDLLRDERQRKFSPASEYLETLDEDETPAVSVHAVCELMAGLNRAGRGIDAMDLLIATAAVVDGSPLVTRNARHFSGIPGLAVIGY